MMADSKSVERMYTEIVLGISKSQSTVEMNDELSSLWNQIAREVKQMKSEGKGFDIPTEIPDVPKVKMVPEPRSVDFVRQPSEPAPPKDQIKGSKKNPEGSAAGPAGSSTIELSEAIETALSNKVTEHNDSLDAGDPSWKRATNGMLRAVYRRGSGAYSTSHRPGISRAAWSMARVNAFLVLLKRGRPANAAYITDNDLLPKGHPRSSRK